MCLSILYLGNLCFSVQPCSQEAGSVNYTGLSLTDHRLDTQIRCIIYCMEAVIRNGSRGHLSLTWWNQPPCRCLLLPHHFTVAWIQYHTVYLEAPGVCTSAYFADRCVVFMHDRPCLMALLPFVD